MHPFTAREARIAASLAAAAMPAGAFLEAGGEATVGKLEAWLEGSPPAQVNAVRALLWTAEAAPLARKGKPFSRLAREDAEAFLTSWSASQGPMRRALLRAILTPLKAAHFDDPKMFAHVGCSYGNAGARDESPRWQQKE